MSNAVLPNRDQVAPLGRK